MRTEYYTVEQASSKLRGLVDPSYLNLLCEQGKISSTSIPSRAGRGDIFMIPESELSHIEVLLSDKPAPRVETKMISLEEASKLINVPGPTLSKWAKEGLVESARSGWKKGSHGFRYMFNKKYLEELDVSSLYKQHKKQEDIRQHSYTTLDHDEVVATGDIQPQESREVHAPEKVVEEPEIDNPYLTADVVLGTEVCDIENEPIKKHYDKAISHALASSYGFSDVELKRAIGDIKELISKGPSLEQLQKAYADGFKDGFKARGEM